MDQNDIHYRTGGKLTHVGVECLPNGQDIPYIVIERIEYKEKENIGGREETGVWVAYFAKNPYTELPFVLNATNRKRLVKLFPECEGYPARLKNVAVRLTKEECRDVQDGGKTWGLRISQIPAQAPKKKVITADKVDVIVDWAKKNKLTIEQVAAQYDLESDMVKDAIVDALSPVSPESDDLP